MFSDSSEGGYGSVITCMHKIVLLRGSNTLHFGLRGREGGRGVSGERLSYFVTVIEGRCFKALPALPEPAPCLSDVRSVK
jgi:hypothetical protein